MNNECYRPYREGENVNATPLLSIGVHIYLYQKYIKIYFTSYISLERTK